ncbi:dihydrolipoyl dehydrogenase family protein [Geminicoccus roseus]|uniref:dihydrolipoyl dehydrogenase family protein n=1 Tax=Geminicoccus roseus TaxID=404900 RepID=UPI0003FF4B66|nr:FAD-dependent oxidoreductase [Geminicoccus roseus]
MAQTGHYDALVIGSGEGGKYLAWHLARAGQCAAVVERRWIGGSCPNIACLPSKNVIWSSHLVSLGQEAARHGIAPAPGGVTMPRVQERKRAMVDGLIDMHLDQFRGSGAELIMGQASLVGDRRVEVQLNEGGAVTLTAERLFLNLGTHAAVPDVPGLAAARPLTHVEALDLDHVPEHLVVIGGGYVGLELAQAYRRFGASVTVLEQGGQIAGREDPDVAATLGGILRADGIELRTGVKLRQVSGRSGDHVLVLAETADGSLTIQASHILAAAGRIPNTAGIGLEEAGIKLTGRGFIAVNDRLETSQPNVWALGEVAGSPQFTHASLDDFRIIRDNLAGGSRSTGDRLVPYALFTEPQLARVGLDEGEAARRGIAVRTASLPIAGVLRARTLSATDGFMKVLVAADSDRILGFTMIGPDASEVVAVVQVAMLAGMPFPVLREAVLAHPTMAEALGPLLGRVPPR